jgi:glycosyltransferase involved in cell wall biosynthesis
VLSQNIYEIKNSPLLSAIVPVTQMQGRLIHLEKWAKEAVENNIQVILVHDWRDDETEQELGLISKKLGQSEKDFISGKYGSPGAARNAGLKIAKGKWITFWDSDDLPNVKNFLEMVDNADQSNFEVAIGSFSYFTMEERIIDKKFTIPRIVDSGDLVGILRNPGLWRWAFRSEIVKKAFFSKNRMGEDQQYLIEISAFKRKKYFYEKIVYQYRINQQMQLTNNPIAVSELRKTISEIATLMDGSYDFVSCFLLVRMNLTSISNGSLFTRLRSFSTLFSILKASGLATSINVLCNVFFTGKVK